MRDLPVFLFGTLRHAPHLAAVLGRDGAVTQAARLLNHQVFHQEDTGNPYLADVPGAEATGIVLMPEGDDLARMEFYEKVFDYDLTQSTALVDEAEVAVALFVPATLSKTRGAPWDLAQWAAAFGEVTTIAAAEIMSAMGRDSPQTVARYTGTIETRAASKLTAQTLVPPVGLRTKGMTADRVEILDQAQSYRRYFAVEDIEYRFPRFDGTMSAPVVRAGFMMGDAVTVLPYDPVRDRVLLIEQHRVGPHLRGDPNPWTLECVAGRIDIGETPEDCARREALEEAGVSIGEVLSVGRYYSSPGAVSEYLFSYIGLTDLPDDAATVAGLATEDEDIRGHVISFDQMMQLVESGEAENGPLLLTTYALALRRDALRGQA